MITTCTTCGDSYEAGSEEQANEPTRYCPRCTRARAGSAFLRKALDHTLASGVSYRGQFDWIAVRERLSVTEVKSAIELGRGSLPSGLPEPRVIYGICDALGISYLDAMKAFGHIVVKPPKQDSLPAADTLSRAVFKLRDHWAESSPEKQQELWRAVHEANAAYFEARAAETPGGGS